MRWVMWLMERRNLCEGMGGRKEGERGRRWGRWMWSG